MTLFTIDKLTEKTGPSSAAGAGARLARRYAPYRPCLSPAAAPAGFASHFAESLRVPRAAADSERGDGLGSTGSSPTDSGTLSPEGHGSPTHHGPVADSKSEDNSTSKPDREKKPPHSYIALIAMAILASPEERLLLCDIYQFIQERYPYYRNNDRSWRNSVRHNLSLNECFVKRGRSGDGRGNFWAVHPANVADFARGDFHRRRARRRVRASDLVLEGYPVYPTHPYPAAPYPAAVPLAAAPLGYVPMTVTTLPPYLPGYPASSLGYPPVTAVSPIAVRPVPSLTAERAPERYSPSATAGRERVSPAEHRPCIDAIAPPTTAVSAYPYSTPQTLAPYSLPVTTLTSPFTTLPSSHHRYPPTTLQLPIPTPVTSTTSGYHGNGLSSMPLYLH